MRILICGAGIAGLTVAWRLHQLGHAPLIVEQSRGLRSDGYMIDFFGSGFDAAQRLGLLPQLEKIHYPIARLAFLGEQGKKRFSLPYKTLRKRLFDDRHFNFLRGDLERVLYSQIEGRVELRFGTTIDAVSQDSYQVRVKLSNGSSEQCDLLIGADGVHSRVRSLVWGEESQFTRYLGFHTAAFILDRIPEALGSTDAFDTLTVPNQQVAVYPIRGGRLATFFAHRAERPAGAVCRPVAVDELNQVYGNMGWIIPELVEKARDGTDLYFDDVSQIQMPSWSSGRVVLLGDACQCMSLLAGQGASMAMAAAYVLAEELGTGFEVDQALQSYERRLRPVVEKQQASGRKMAAWFVPASPFRLMMRDFVMRLSVWPMASLLVKNSFAGASIFRTGTKK